jgi:chromosome segregation ATPase
VERNSDDVGERSREFVVFLEGRVGRESGVGENKMTITVKFQAIENHTLELIRRKNALDSYERNLEELQNKLETIRAEREILVQQIEENRKFLRSETQRMAAEGHNHFSGALESVDHPKVGP